MIPKIIHYCWLSNDPIPARLKKCMDSWKKQLHDYEFMLWNFDRFAKDRSVWVSQAFDSRKYAFAADYIRLYALYNYGGIYLDMDVEVVRPFDSLLGLKTMLCWQKGCDGLEVATFGAEKGSKWVKECLDYYQNREFILPDGTCSVKPLPNIVEDILRHKGYKLVDCSSIADAKNTERQYAERNDSYVLPILTDNFFSPCSYDDATTCVTDDTYSIHHFAGTWLPWYSRMKRTVYNSLGLKNQSPLKMLKDCFGK